MFEVSVREVPEQTVLTEQRRVRVRELPDWIGEVVDRQHASLAAAGGSPVAPIVIYHEEVNEVSDGLVEVCTPVDPALAGRVDATTRVEPAHREAYVAIPKALVAFPDILSAYDAVAMWIEQEGETAAGSPREVYFADFAAAAPDDLVVDIAFPIRPR
jgi:effector-binding domain-containing protein